MQIGLASNNIAHVATSRDWGYEFVEIFAELLRPLEPDSVWPSRRRELEDTGAALTNLCAWIPAEARYVGPSPDWGRTRDFVETSVGRAAEVGVSVFNWGSPHSKSIPVGWPISKALEQIERAAHLIADVVGRYDATCVIEPINPRECNVIYYVTDGVLLAASVDRPQIKVLADFFHMSLQSEPLEHLEAARGWLGHTHTSGPDRYFPQPGQGWDQRSFLAALRASGYDGRVSVESWAVRPGSTFAEDARASATYLRRLLSELDGSV
jgi:sugar phosphate isomerase/epimerase